MQNRVIKATGYNGLPSRLKDTHERLHDRETKNRLIVHAELNAVLNAACGGVMTSNTTLYLAATDDTGLVWGGPPCVRCAVELMQAGIVEIVAHPFKPGPSRWRESIEEARELLAEAGIQYREVPHS